MLRTLLDDLESALTGAKASDLMPRSRGDFAIAADDAATFSEWLPYRAYLDDRQVFDRGEWAPRLNVPRRDFGTGMTPDEVARNHPQLHGGAIEMGAGWVPATGWTMPAKARGPLI